MNSPNNCRICGHHIVPNSLAEEGLRDEMLRHITTSAHLDQVLDLLLDAEWIWLKSTCWLSSDFINEVNMRHMFPVFHNANNACLLTKKPFRRKSKQES